jgi:processive rubber oxygenase RoxA-like protein
MELATATSISRVKRFFMTPRRRYILGGAIVLGALVASLVWVKFFRREPAPYFASDEEHFLYGSVGTEEQEGVPYWIWLVLPRIFPEYLPAPGGYAALGVLAPSGHEMPIGLSKVTIGFPRVGINCAMCHTASVRLRPADPPTIYPAAPSHQTAPQMYLRFLFACASDPRFTADTILAEISRNYRLSALDRMIYRFIIIPRTRTALRELDQADAWMRSRPDWGRGRIDPFNPVKFRVLGQPIDATIGNSDMVPLWNLKAHTGHAYHWDGLNTELREVVLSSAIGDGATRKWVDRDMRGWDSTDPRTMSSLRRVQNYISERQPPKYPFAIDGALAAVGAPIYAAECASCHALGGARTGTVIPVAEVATDRHRLDMWTKASAAAYNAYGEGHSWKFSHFRTTEGYVSVPLEGLWLRAPYLHNGSVPTLTDLLEPVERRPARFWRGYDVYDPMRVGFVAGGEGLERSTTLYDVARPGNGNGGHVYGTALPADQKRALLEYLKTL